MSDPAVTPREHCGGCGRIIVEVETDNGGEMLVHWGTARPTCDPAAIDDQWAPRATYAWDLYATP